MLFRSDLEAKDDTYRNLRDNHKLESLRLNIEAMWNRYRDFADPEFVIEIASQFQQRFWEMFLTCTLKEYGIQPISKSKNGADIKMNIESNIAWIEAIALEPGQGPDAMDGSEEHGLIPENKIVLRFQAGIWDKFVKAEKYLQNGIMSTQEAYIIAINGYNIPYAENDDAIPYAIQAVLPLGLPTVTINHQTGEIVSKNYAYRPNIEKKSGTKISTTTFLGSEYSVISGILYSNASVYNLNDTKNDFVFLHNPNALNPLSKGWFKVGREYWVENENFKCKTWA